MAATITPYRSGQQAGHDGFAQLLRAEWTKFRTMRGWVIAMLAAAAATALAPIALAGIAKSNDPETCVHGQCQVEGSNVATGPAGEAVTDSFYFVHQPLAGNGSLTAAITSLRGTGPSLRKPTSSRRPRAPSRGPRPGSSSRRAPGRDRRMRRSWSPPGHGVRMQYDFTHDIAGPAGPVSAASPQWLRLTRSGNTLTGYDSADGRHWTTVGTADLAGLPATVQAGLFVASPDYDCRHADLRRRRPGGNRAHAGHRSVRPASAGRATGPPAPGPAARSAPRGPRQRSPGTATLACGPPPQQPGRFRQSGGTVTVAGSGDIAPFVPIVDPLQVSFYGTLFGAIAVIALGAVFITGEYRRGMIRTTLAASPRRGRVLAAKAIVIGSVTFAAGLAGAAVAFPFVERKLNALGWKPPVWPVWSLTSQVGLRVVVGTAALLAVTALLALAAGAILRRSAGAITAVIGLVIFPLVLAIILPLARRSGCCSTPPPPRSACRRPRCAIRR